MYATFDGSCFPGQVVNLINFDSKYKPTDSGVGVTLLRRKTSYSGVRCLGGGGLFTLGDSLLHHRECHRLKNCYQPPDRTSAQVSKCLEPHFCTLYNEVH